MASPSRGLDIPYRVIERSLKKVKVANLNSSETDPTGSVGSGPSVCNFTTIPYDLRFGCADDWDIFMVGTRGPLGLTPLFALFFGFTGL